MKFATLSSVGCAALLASFAVPLRVAAQGSCDVVVRLDDPSPQTFFAFGVDYSATNGQFIGNSTQVSFGGVFGPEPIACMPLAGAFFDALDDKAGTLSLFFADSLGLVGPISLASCVFEFQSGSSCPQPTDFSIVAHAFPDQPFPPPPFPPVPAVSVASVTQRTAVCGDGFQELPEQCDDGNTTDGDCCSSTCTFEPQGGACDDGSVCTSGQTCDGSGACVGGSTLICDDGVFCTHDFCDPVAGCQSVTEPTSTTGGCRHISAAKLDVRDHATKPTADRVKLTASLDGGDIGDPGAGTDYALCVFDTSGGGTSLAIKLEIPAGAPWVAAGTNGFLYIDPTRAADGVEKVRLKQKRGGTKLHLLGKGGTLPLPGPFNSTQYLAQDPQVTVEVQNSAGECWSLVYDAFHGTIRHKPDRFTAKRR